MASSLPLLYRKRLIPAETLPLSEDQILYMDSFIIVTSWKAIHPKPSLCRGYSCYFLQEGFKVSKFYRTENEFRHWYCDIIDTKYLPEENAYLFTDLLADVIIKPDGFVKVVDLDELTEAYRDRMITEEQLLTALTHLDKLLKLIYDGRFGELIKEIEERETLPGPV